MSAAEDFVFSTLIARHPDPAMASRALAIVEAIALHEAADAVRWERNATSGSTSRDYQRGMTRAIEVLRYKADQLNAPAPEGKSSRPAADATPEYQQPQYPAERVQRYVDALRGNSAPLAGINDLAHLVRAVMAVADAETDPVYRDGYATGREHAGAAGWLLQHFTPVFTTSDGTDVPAKELRCGTCNQVTRDARPRTLLDHVVAAAQHECLPNPDASTRKDGA